MGEISQRFHTDSIELRGVRRRRHEASEAPRGVRRPQERRGVQKEASEGVTGADAHDALPRRREASRGLTL